MEMERFVIVVFVLGLNALYWMDYLKTWNQTSDDGAVGKGIMGLIIIGLSGGLIFNLDHVL